MSAAAQRLPPRRALGVALRNPAYLVLIALFAAIAVLTPQILQPAGFLNFLMRAAPLAIVSLGQLFVVVVGGFDLSVGSLITLAVMGSALLINGDPSRTWPAIAVVYGLGLSAGLVNGLVVACLKVPSIIATLGTLLSIKGIALAWSGGSPRGYLPDNFRQFGRLRLHDVPLVGTLPLAVIVLALVVALAWWLLHGTGFGRQALVVGDNPRAAELAGIRVGTVRVIAFLLSATAAVTSGILLGGFAGVSTDVGDGYELQSVAAAVLGGAQLMGGGGSVPGVTAGALSLTALFTLLNLLGLPKPLRDAVQGVILIAAVAQNGRRQSMMR